MSEQNPVIMSIDDDPGVSRAAQRDLRRHYGEGFRVLRADSGSQGLELLGQVRLREEPVALLVADQRMPRMTGVEFLERAIGIVPEAKRVLLTAYADTQAAIDAINRVSLDHYLMKPWDPPEEQLYPVLDDLLSDWEAGSRGNDGIRVVGHRWSRESHELKDFLARNNVPYRWLDVEREPGAAQLIAAAGADPARLPVLVFPDGEILVAPGLRTVAERVGMTTRAEAPFYDLVVVGGGPAGLSGADLTRRASAQAQRFGAQMLSVSEVVGLEARGPARVVRLAGGDEIAAHAVVVATGVEYRRLEVPGAEELAGRGLYYGGSRSEALSVRGERVFVVGCANSAGQAALYFSGFAESVTILCRGSELGAGMSRYLTARIEGVPNISVRLRTDVTAFHGDGALAEITVADRGAGTEERLPAGAVFVFIGARPNTEWLEGVVARDERGFILTGPDLASPDARPRWTEERPPLLLESSLPGVFVAGDVRQQSIKRVAAAVGDGSMAVQLVHQYLGATE